jgi:hypothetical protein
MAIIEQIIRPFTDADVGPTPYKSPGATPPPPVLVKIGMVGGTQHFQGKFSGTVTQKMGAVHTETASNSGAIQAALSGSGSGKSTTGW